MLSYFRSPKEEEEQAKLGDDPIRDTKGTMDYIKSIKNFKVSKESGRDLTTYFPDGKRRIDYVLVHNYREKVSFMEQIFSRRHSLSQEKINAIRKRYFENLREAGLEIQKMAIDSGDSYIYFTLIHVPWNVLANYAELMNFKLPFQERDDDNNYTQYHWSYPIFNSLTFGFFYNKIPNHPVNYFTCDFRNEYLENYIGFENKDTFFETVDRIKIAHEVLEETQYGKRKAEKGITQLIKLKIFSTAYPLHDGPYKYKGDYKTQDNLNNRQILYYYWARFRTWRKYQPLDHIQVYFGEKIALYFAWMGLYVSWLFPLAIIGFFVFLFGIITVKDSSVVQDVCVIPLTTYPEEIIYKFIKIPIRKNRPKVSDPRSRVNSKKNDTVEIIGNLIDLRSNETEEGHDIMCPLCDKCEYWDLSKSCLNYIVAYVTDHPGTVFFAIFTSLWASSLLQSWKRLRSRLAYNWNCYDIVEEEERPRVQYVLRAPGIGINPVTGAEEPVYPYRLKRTHYFVTNSIISILIMSVFIFFVALMLYRVVLTKIIVRIYQLMQFAEYLSVFTGFLIHYVILRLLDVIYTKIAHRLNDWEVHRTETDYEKYLTIKLFVFYTINIYSSVFYVAFIKGRFVGYPGHYRYFLGARLESCDHDNCASELALNILVFFFGNLITNNITESIKPLYKNWRLRRKNVIRRLIDLTEVRPQWLEDYCKRPVFNVWDDYMSMVIQFGFVTIFVAAFPIAPLLALLCNAFQIRLDAKKYLVYGQRPLGQRIKDIGIWFTILKTIVQVSVITNGCVIAFTLDFLPKMLYMYEKGTWDLHGYVAFSMSYSKEKHCRYHGFRDADGALTVFFWKLLAIRLAFVIIFHRFIFAVAKVINLAFPDIPHDIDIQMKRERYLAKQALTLDTM